MDQVIFKRVQIALIIASLFFLASTINAQAIYNNINSTNYGSDSLDSYGPLGNSFSTGTSAVSLDDIQLLVGLAGAPNGSFAIQLYSDNQTSPGTLLNTFGIVDDSSLSANLSIIDIPLISPYALDANTRYWLMLISLNSNANWGWSLDQTALGVSGEYLTADGHVSNNLNGPYQMKLSSSAPVPEPASLILIGSGLLGLAGFRKKLKK